MGSIGHAACALPDDPPHGHAAVPWHFLYFFPEPHGQGSLRPTLAWVRFCGMTGSFGAPEKVICCLGGCGGRARCTRAASSRDCEVDVDPEPPASSIFQRILTTRS